VTGSGASFRKVRRGAEQALRHRCSRQIRTAGGAIQAEQVGLIPHRSESSRFVCTPCSSIFGSNVAYIIDEPPLEQRHDLSSAQKDLLEKRLLATMNGMAVGWFGVLQEALRVTQLPELIGRPINRDQYRGGVHDWLRETHSTKGGGFQLPGGFRATRSVTVSSLEQTSYAVELLRIYGIQVSLELNGVRCYLRPLMYRSLDDKYVAAVTLDRLNHLPEVSFPKWLDDVYYERRLIMAVLLVALCLYATMSSPAPSSTSLMPAAASCDIDIHKGHTAETAS
jgi:hypothetical protein